LLGEHSSLGCYFKAKTVTREKTNCMYFLTPHYRSHSRKMPPALYQEKEKQWESGGGNYQVRMKRIGD